MAEEITLRLPKLMPEQDACCDRFEAAWKAAGTASAPPRIEDYLGDPGPVRVVLLHELTALDLVYRRRRGETPPAEEYLSRFPELRPDWLAQELTSAPEPATATRTTDGASPVQRMRCPHCHNPISLADHHGDEVLCPGCGGSFRVRDASLTDTTSASRPMGKFALLQRVGQGAFGAVWKARDTVLSRVVALKIPHAGRLTEAEELERFHREARAAAQLRHPGIVPVYEVLTLEGLPVIVSEFVEGVTLKDFLEVRKLPFHESAALMANLADALDYAHQMGLVHRDIKPANIMMENARQGDETGQTAQRRTLLMDFGLALRDEAEVTLTLDGQLIGTPAYMSPEQAAGRGHTADRRSDVYGLGVVFYELLTGELPFRGSKAMMLYQVLAENPQSPRKVNEKIPRDLETICLKCLRKEPEKRYRSARELADDLRRWQVGEPIQARPVGRVERTVKWVRRNPVVAALLVMVVLAIAAGIGAFSVKYYDAVEQTLIANSERTKAEEQTEIARTQTAIALTQTGLAETRRQQAEALVKEKDKALAKADEENRKAQEQLAANAIIMAQAAWEKGDAVAAQAHLDAVPEKPHKVRNFEWHYLRRQYEGCLFSLPLFTEQVMDLAFSPDGERLAIACRDGTVRLWDARTGKVAVELREHIPEVVVVVFISDGIQVATLHADGAIRFWDARTGALARSVKLKGRIGRFSRVAFSPDGRNLATTNDGSGSARLWDSRNGEMLLEIGGQSRSVNNVAFSPDGTRLVTVADKVRVWDARTGILTLELKGRVVELMTSVAFSPDGRRLAILPPTSSYYIRENKAELWDTHTGDLLLQFKNEHVTAETSYGWSGVLSRIAFSADGLRLVTVTNARTVEIWDARSGAPMFVLKGLRGFVNKVVFSPDGARLATLENNKTVRLWDAQNGTLPSELNGERLPASSVAFSSDGNRMATGHWEKKARIWDARTRELLLDLKGHTGSVHSVALNRDGTLLATGSSDKTARLWNARTGDLLFELKGHAGIVESVAFNPDGTRLATGGGSQDNTARIWSAHTGKLLLELNGHTAEVTSVAFNPDGTQLATCESTTFF